MQSTRSVYLLIAFAEFSWEITVAGWFCGLAEAFCGVAEPFCEAAEPFCRLAEPFCSLAEAVCGAQNRSARPQNGFAASQNGSAGLQRGAAGVQNGSARLQDGSVWERGRAEGARRGLEKCCQGAGSVCRIPAHSGQPPSLFRAIAPPGCDEPTGALSGATPTYSPPPTLTTLPT